MRFLAFSMLSLSFFATAIPQEVKHAPTLQSCAADLNLWTSQIPGWPNPSMEQARQGTKPLTFQVMGARVSSLSDCSGAYPILTHSRSNELSALESLLNIYLTETSGRYFNFLDRHDLIVKFIQEDEVGKR
jgi:hypothetical protein